MLFVQLDVNWPDHPKVMDVGLAGAGLHAAALCIAKRMETDGVLDRRHLHRLGAADQLIDLLIEVGLFDHIDDDRVQVHGWLDRNPSQGAIAATRTAKAAIGRDGNHRRWGHPGPVESCPRCNPPENGSKPRSSQGAIGSDRSPSRSPIRSEVAIDIDKVETEQSEPLARRTPSTELALVPTNGSSPPAKKTTGYADDFEAWWALYPRKVAKAAAAKAWKGARRATDADTLTSALLASVRAWQANGRATEHIPHAATWLNGRRWEDQPDTDMPHRPEPKGFAGIRAAFGMEGA